MSLLFSDRPATPADVTSRPGPWPDVNQRIEVFGSAWGDWLPSRVEDRHGVRLIVAVPQDPGQRRPIARPADWVALRWTTSRGVGMVEASVVSATRAGIVPTWELTARSDPLLYQRRRYLRVPVFIPGRAIGSRGDCRITLLDLAEGGIRCLAPHPVPFEPDEVVEIIFNIDGLPLSVRAEVVRWAVAPGGLVAALSFIDVPRSDADRLRRFVFRQELATGGTR